MIRVARCISFLFIMISSFAINAQVDNPYHVNGNAFQESCNCYTLTPDEFRQSGSVWNINKINLNNPFDYIFNVFLGCHDGDGADGIAFVLQPISTSIGAQGGGIGFDGVSPSIGVIIDTWQNTEDNDPVADHIAIQKNGIIDHSVTNDLAGPVPAIASGANIEDCYWHTLRVSWDPGTKVLKAQVDGLDRVQAIIDLTKDIFKGDPFVFWGFTAATGGAKNHQRICTSLDPAFALPDGQSTCFPQSLQFIDSSKSFGSIVKWFWDFGDGNTSGLKTPPEHNYAAPGIYEVKLSILGNNGCLSEPFVKTIVMGTKPVSKFTYSPNPVCEGVPVNFLDASYVEFGTINKWIWQIGSEAYNDQNPPPLNFSGTGNVALSVETLEGCVSTVTNASISTFPVPSIDFQLSDICITEPSLFKGINNSPSIEVQQWKWKFGDGAGETSLAPEQNYRYKKGGVYNVQLTGLTQEGCPSVPVTKSISVYETRAFAGNDTIIATDQSVRLNATGGETYQWTPSEGLSADNIANPVATLNHSTSFILTASTVAGCETSDTLNIKVFKGPSFYVPSAFSPNNDGRNDRFQFIAVGMQSVDLFQVYNRYGQLIYSSNNIGTGWDGKLNGILQPSGTYVWMIKGVDLSGVPHFKKGTVSLVR